jgi:hypothetical protein
MREKQHNGTAASFPAWRHRLEQAVEPHLKDELQNFVQMLETVGTPMMDSLAVHFIYYDPRAHHVAVTGEFTDWGRTGVMMPLMPLRHTGLFHATLELDGPARLEYKLVVDGRVIADPLCPQTVDNGIGERNSYFMVGDFREPPELNWVPTIPMAEWRSSTSRAGSLGTGAGSTSTYPRATTRSARSAFPPSMYTTAVSTSIAGVCRRCWTI